MAINEVAGSDRSGFTPRITNDGTYGDVAAHAYTGAGRDEFLSARARADNSIPADFPGLRLYNSATAADAAAPATDRAVATTAPGAESTVTPAMAAAVADGAAAPSTIASVADNAAVPATASIADRGLAVTAPTTDSVSIPSTTAATAETASPAAAGQLTADQISTSSQATGQTIVPYTMVDTNGVSHNMEEVGTAVNTTGANNQQYYITDAHTVIGNNTDGSGNYAQASGQIMVNTPNGNFSAHVAGIDPTTDLAALQLDGPVLDTASLPINSNYQFTNGEPITSWGYPFGQDQQALQSTTAQGSQTISSYGPLMVDTNENGNRSMVTGANDMAPGTSGSAAIVPNENGQASIGGILDKSTGGQYPSLDGTPLNDSIASAAYDPNATTLYTPASSVQDLMDTVTGIPSYLNVIPQLTGTSGSGSAAAPESSATTTSAPVTDSSVAAPTAVALDSGSATGASAASTATTSELTPQQAAVAPSTVQIQTTELTQNADGTFSEGVAVGSGSVVYGDNGQMFILTADHVPAGTPQTDAQGATTYAEGPSKVIFNDGSTAQATVVANASDTTGNNSVETAGNSDVALMAVSLPNPGITAPVPGLNISSDQPAAGDQLSAVGYQQGQSAAQSLTYLGQTTPSAVDGNANDTYNVTSNLTLGPGVHGMSGSPIVDANGNIVGVYSSGNNTNTLDTPGNTAENLLDSQSVFSPNYLYNQVYGTPQPTARPDDRGNGSDQTVTGATLTSGGNTTHLDAPDPAPATTTDDAADPPTAANVPGDQAIALTTATDALPAPSATATPEVAPAVATPAPAEVAPAVATPAPAVEAPAVEAPAVATPAPAVDIPATVEPTAGTDALANAASDIAPSATESAASAAEQFALSTAGAQLFSSLTAPSETTELADGGPFDSSTIDASTLSAAAAMSLEVSDMANAGDYAMAQMYVDN